MSNLNNISENEIKRREAIREAMRAYYMTERGIYHRKKLSRLQSLKMTKLNNIFKNLIKDEKGNNGEQY